MEVRSEPSGEPDFDVDYSGRLIWLQGAVRNDDGVSAAPLPLNPWVELLQSEGKAPKGRLRAEVFGISTRGASPK